MSPSNTEDLERFLEADPSNEDLRIQLVSSALRLGGNYISVAGKAIFGFSPETRAEPSRILGAALDSMGWRPFIPTRFVNGIYRRSIYQYYDRESHQWVFPEISQEDEYFIESSSYISKITKVTKDTKITMKKPIGRIKNVKFRSYYGFERHNNMSDLYLDLYLEDMEKLEPAKFKYSLEPAVNNWKINNWAETQKRNFGDDFIMRADPKMWFLSKWDGVYSGTTTVHYPRGDTLDYVVGYKRSHLPDPGSREAINTRHEFYGDLYLGGFMIPHFPKIPPVGWPWK